MKGSTKKQFFVAVRLAIAASLIGSSPAWATSSPGTSGADVLNIPVGARAIAMGQAYTAVADDVSSLYWNPAGLALMQQREASFSYDQMPQSVNYSNLGLGIPLENGAIGGSLSYLGYGNIDGYDNNGNPTGSQSAHSAVATLGASWLGNQWSLGFNAKGIQENLADVTATGAAFDVGANVIYPQPVLGGTIRFGAVVQNMGAGMNFINQTDPMPLQFKVGVAALQMMDKKLNIGLDMTKPRDDVASAQLGAEYWLIPMFAVRAGYDGNHDEGSGIRCGMGLRVKGISFDYAYASMGELGITNRYELSFKFGEPRPILTSEEQKILHEAKAAMRQGRYDRAVLLFDSLIELEPHYKPARRLVQVAMANMEHQQKEMMAKEGTTYHPEGVQAAQKPSLPDLDDLEQLLSIGQPKAAQAGTANNGQAGGQQ